MSTSQITATSIGGSSALARRGLARRVIPVKQPTFPPVRGAQPTGPVVPKGPTITTGTEKCPVTTVPVAVRPDLDIMVTRREKQELLAQALRSEETLPTLIIESSLITIFSYEELADIAVCKVNNPASIGPNTVNDTRMGVIEDTKLCATCHKDNVECPGHLGYIELVYPIYHPLFLRTIVQVLTCVCNSCGGLLLTRQEMKDKGILLASGPRRLQMLEKECKGLLCRRKPEEGSKECRPNPEYLVAKLKDSKQIMYKIPAPRGTKKEEKESKRTVSEIEKILNAISDEDAALMGFSNGAHPRRMIMRAIPVIPPNTRPPAIRDGVIWPNPITSMYIDIIKHNNALADPKLTEKDRDDKLAGLFFHIEHLIDNTDGKYAPQQNKAFESIKQLVQGKEAIIRGLLMGKRVNFSARTVLSPDPNLKFGQIRIPKAMASTLTQSVTINQYNIESMTKLLREGKITHVTRGSGKLKGSRLRVTDIQRKEGDLQIGDKVDRWLQNGDYVLFNRQPTLHKQGMMGFEVVLSDQLTIGLHLSYTTPFNADFDGDEGNLHAMQALDAIAEAATIANVTDCIMNPQTNRPIMAAVYDTLTGAYLLTQPDTMVDVDDFNDCLMLITAIDSIPTLFERLEIHNIPPRSGRALFSALLPPDFYYDSGEVKIRDGVLIQGVITKSQIGNSSNSIVQVLWKNYGKERTTDFLTDLPFVINRWLASRAFSVGLKDCLPTDENHAKLIRAEIAKAQLKVAAMGPPPPDPLERERYEKQIVTYVNTIKDIGARITTESLVPDNALRVMTKSGAKGAELNIAQITGLLGQQFLKGERLKPTLTQGSRCLPYFEPNDLSIEAHGFCQHSFLQGLTPAELFFHQAGGREGLMDTAIKTSETGSMHHRIVKALEDIRVAYDGSVRNANGNIFQFTYGEDGFDAGELQMIKTKTGETAFFIDINASVGRINARYGY